MQNDKIDGLSEFQKQHIWGFSQATDIQMA